ncbi:MAG TPA: DUF6271 family protein [Micromonosporaceae bacterium]|nr:DUF6271 family protein [Micromonosporaceae bacterium]
MDRICLTLPTNRACPAMISAIGEEVRYAAERFGVEVYLLVLDSSDRRAYAAHAAAIAREPRTPNVVTLHLDEAAQRRFLDRVVDRADVAKPQLIADLMLPAGVSYGACTNRAFLIASALGCRSVHRRDSDSRYQVHHGAKVFPIHHELAALGKRAADAVGGVSQNALDPAHAGKPVVLVGGSFVGELSVDIADIRERDRAVYHDVVSLWAPGDASDEEKAALVEESFAGAGTEVFTGDHSTLAIVDPMRVDMCNIGLFQVHEDIPLLPATNTIGSDYFLIHVVHKSGLPGVLHNRNIVNFHTDERKTGPGFAAYHLRLTKFFLSMLYLHFIYRKMEAAGGSLLNGEHRVCPAKIVDFVRESTWLGKEENVARLHHLEHAYRRLGGRYTGLADALAARGQSLLQEAQRDIEEFALLIEAWQPLVSASRATSIDRPSCS